MPATETNSLADRLYEMTVGWLQAAPSEEDIFLANYKAKLARESSCLCVRCKHLKPALDANIQKAYLGQVRETRMAVHLVDYTARLDGV